MATKNTTTTAKAKKTAKADKVKRQRFAIQLTDPSGGRLAVVAVETKGGFRSSVVHTAAGEKGKRAMIETHVAFASGIERVERLAAEAEAQGWAKKQKKAQRPPAFTSLPKPNTTPKPVDPKVAAKLKAIKKSNGATANA